MFSRVRQADHRHAVNFPFSETQSQDYHTGFQYDQLKNFSGQNDHCTDVFWMMCKAGMAWHKCWSDCGVNLERAEK